MFGALSETSGKLSSKFNVFSYMILRCWLNIFESFIIILYDFEKQRLGSFAWKDIVCTTKVHLFNKEEEWNFLKWLKI